MESKFFSFTKFVERLDKFIDTIEKRRTPRGFIELHGCRFADIWPLGLAPPDLGGKDDNLGMSSM